MKDFIPVNEPLLNGNEKLYLKECIDTGWISSEGPFVEKLELKIADLCNRKHAFAVCNGSAALDLAVIALGIGKGDEVIMPTFTIISCALAVIRAGATPVYVDADPQTWNIKVNEIEALITEQTKAIMAVHIYGLTVDMDPLFKIAKKHNLAVIEDAAEVIGQTYKGKPCGSLGTISTFSFYPNKHITTGEGGMVLVNDDEIAAKCKDLRNLCFGKKDRFIHEDLGWNYRMSNLQAAVGVAQFEQLETHIKRKKEIGRTYQEFLSNYKSFFLPLEKTEYCSNIYWIFGLVSRDPQKNNKWWIQKLKGLGIGSRPFFYPMHKQPCLNNLSTHKKEFHSSENLAKYGFYLPSGLSLKKDDIIKVVDALNKIANE